MARVESTKQANNGASKFRNRRAHEDLGEVPVTLVDRLEVEGVLVAGVVEVELLVELGDEAVGLLAVGVELAV